MKRISIGIDTSCYTTSVVAIDEDNSILFEERIMLTVKEGTLGLRQSDAFFQHVQNLPKLYSRLVEKIDLKYVKNIVVSDKPRPLEQSYMPVFTAGENFSKVIADTLSIPLIRLSHQENHLYASLLECEREIDGFIGVHISGGTSEILKVSCAQKLNIKLIGESLDISFGKLIDRIGVYMGLFFPCGKELDELARMSSVVYPLKIASKGYDFNISGIENRLKQLYDKDKDKSAVAYSLFDYISKLLVKHLQVVLDESKVQLIIMSGGVSANSIIRQKLEMYFGRYIIFSSIQYATDHAIGNAYYGKMVIDNET